MIDRIRDTASGLGDRVRDLRPARKDDAGRAPGLRSSIPPAPPKPGTPQAGKPPTRRHRTEPRRLRRWTPS